MTLLRRATAADLPAIFAIVGQAQAFLGSQGIDQWQDGYPDEQIMRADIANGTGYVLEQDGRIIGITTLTFTGEPTYDQIYDGAWTTTAPYACVHRLALSASARGTGASSELMREIERIVLFHGFVNIRIDTHHGNLVMQGMLLKNGYTPCGTIHLENGMPRLALEKTVAGEGTSGDEMSGDVVP